MLLQITNGRVSICYLVQQVSHIRKSCVVLFVVSMILLSGCQANEAREGVGVDVATKGEESDADIAQDRTPMAEEAPIAEEAPTAEEAPQVFEGTGVVRNITPSKTFIVIEHGAIEGFMGAMTMPFPLSDEKLLKGIEIGDDVDFGLEFDGQNVSVIALKKR